MTNEELIEKAVYKANARIDRGLGRDTLLHEITHYFDKDMVEIGHTSIFGNEPTIFEGGRIWDKGILAKYRVYNLKTFKEV